MGLRAFADHELLELLLSYAIPRRDVKTPAKDLLRLFGDLAGVLGAPDHALLEVKGIGPAALALIRLAAGLSVEASRPARRRGRQKVGSIREALRLLGRLTPGKREEELNLIYLDAGNGVLGHEVIARGTANEVAVLPRQVLERLLERRAGGFLVAHNHPSGDIGPSDADRALTRALAQGAAALGVRFLDHVILGDGRHYSFQVQEPGLFRQG
ncbi:MAG: DNA repair protein RadC [Planctomycetes bacterium]|nr:DNA repair protein RadC [Planctomycetota bacterium]